MSVDTARYQLLQPTKSFYPLLLVFLLAFVSLGAYCAYQLEHTGHIISGMNNRVVWGLPHVFAISLVVAASGALNAATLSSVFGVNLYKPYARLSVVLAIALLIGGLVVLVLDLGRPDRLFIAMTTYNFRSIFSWNIFLYTGFIVVGVVYLWMMLERRMNRFTRSVGVFALLWRVILTTGTGSIFGFLVGRSSLDAAILAPLFIALSLVLGTAVFTLLLMAVCRLQNAMLSEELLQSLSKMLIWCILALLYFSVVHHLTNLYVVQHGVDEKFVLFGPFAALFWLGHIGIGIALPVFLLAVKKVSPLSGSVRLVCASTGALLGGLALVYVIVIGSQAVPQVLFPGKTVIASTFGDAGFASYQASGWEWGVGLGGVSLSLLLFFLILRILPLSPQLSR